MSHGVVSTGWMRMSNEPTIHDVLDAALIVDEYCYANDIDLFGEQANEQADSVYQRIGVLAAWKNTDD